MGIEKYEEEDEDHLIEEEPDSWEDINFEYAKERLNDTNETLSPIQEPTDPSRLSGSYDEQAAQQIQFEDQKDDEHYPILYLDVNLGRGWVERLVIHDGDEPMLVAEEFCNWYCKLI